MTDVIDVSEWLHASYNKVYPERMGKISELNGRYHAIAPQNIFDYLYREGMLSPSSLSSAEFFFTLNEVATSKTGFAKMIGMFSEIGHDFGGNKIPGFCPTTLMLLIAKNMVKWQYAMVERICLQPLRLNDIAWAGKMNDSITQSFDALGKSIEISIDTLKERLDNHR